MVNYFRRLFTHSKDKKIDINVLKQRIQSIIITWTEINKILKTSGKIDLSYLWLEEVKNHIKFIKNECKKINDIYKINKRKYSQQIKDTKQLIKHIKKIKSTEKWLFTLESYIKKMGSDLESIVQEMRTVDMSSQGNISRREFLERLPVNIAVLRAASGIALSATVLKMLEQYLRYEVSKLPESNKDGLSILISEPKSIDARFGFHFRDIYISRMQLAFGFKARYVFVNATGKDLQKVLYDPSIQNVCILGHGTNRGWEATPSIDSQIYVDFDLLKSWYLEHPSQKRGYFIKHTCGEEVKEDMLTFVNPEAFHKVEEERIRFQEYVNLRLKQFPQEEKARYIKIVDERIKSAHDEYERKLFLNTLQKVNKMSLNEFRNWHLPHIPERIFVIWSKKFGSESLGYEIGVLVLNKEKSSSYISDINIPEVFKSELLNLNDRIKNFLDDPNNQIRYPKLLGFPFFEQEKIMAWTRITYIQDFLFNPFANTQIAFDKYSSRVMKLVEKIKNTYSS